MTDNYTYFLQLAKKYPSKPYVPTPNLAPPSPTVVPAFPQSSTEPPQIPKGKNSWIPLIVLGGLTFLIFAGLEARKKTIQDSI